MEPFSDRHRNRVPGSERNSRESLHRRPKLRPGMIVQTRFDAYVLCVCDCYGTLVQASIEPGCWGSAETKLCTFRLSDNMIRPQTPKKEKKVCRSTG